MTKRVSKEDIVNVILSENKELSPTLPLLAFDNETRNIKCSNCDSINKAKSFRYNASASSGYDSVIFDWEPNLNRLIVRGDVCYDCDRHNIVFEYPQIKGSTKENDPLKINNVELGSSEHISSNSGRSI